MTESLHKISTDEGHLITIIDAIEDPLQNNVDVYVDLRDGRRFVGTFFTLSNVAWLFEKNEQTGECASGLYLWATDMILVKELTPEVIVRTVLDLINEEEFETAFSQIHVEDPGGDNWNDFLERVRNQPENVLEGDGWVAVMVHPTAEQLPPHKRKTPMSVDAYLGIDETVHFAQFETLGCSIRGVGLYCRYVFDRRWVNWVQVLGRDTITEVDVREGFDRITEIVRGGSWPAFQLTLTEALQPHDRG
jgi:hypothetical protein